MAGVECGFYRTQDVMYTRRGFFAVFFIGLTAAALAYYGLIHWRVIWMREPVALREPAVVIAMRGYLDPSAPRPYSLESFPEYTNLYGMGYIWAGAPFARWLPFSEYSNLRLANAFFLLLILIIIGSCGQETGWYVRGFFLVTTYCVFIRSASMAASPDVLGCLFYTLTWVVAVQGRFRPWSLVSSLAIGALAFLTKPYCVLGIAGVASYLFFFRSKKIGLIYSGGALALFGVIIVAIRNYYPYYFDAVVGVHAAATTHRLLHGLKQWGEFAALLPVPCYLALAGAVGFLKKSVPIVKFSIATDGPLIVGDLGATPYAWGSFVATAALAALLCWHGGAYLIYFWHLLLPLLALWLVGSSFAARPSLPFYCLNIAGLLALAPSLPLIGSSPGWLALQSSIQQLKNPYVDPYFEALQHRDKRPIPDNGQSEYILYAASVGSNPLLREMSKRFVEQYLRSIFDQRYDGVILVQNAYFHELVMEQIDQNYQFVASYKVRPYYYTFRTPIKFGVYDAPVLVLMPKSTLGGASPTDPEQAKSGHAKQEQPMSKP